MEFWIFVIGLAVVGLWARGSRLKRRVETLEQKLQQQTEQLDRLMSSPWQAPAVPPPPPPVWDPAAAPPPPPPLLPEPEQQPEPAFAESAFPSLPGPPAEPEPAAEPEPEPEPEPVFSLSDRLREKLSGEEWEALVGGSLLNKLGSLILVIAIALGLTYSATRMGPGGRVILALGISFSMIGGGVLLERRQKYLIFARGLLGGGWAALYLTAYAMHALDAARVIQDPLLGGILLVAVAAGMILHSLRYRSQVVTGLAYFAAFTSLAITPVAAFAVVALAPLGASLLFIAWRFEWFAMALFGLVATYGTCASKATGTATVLETQSILGVYWLLFEAFEILRSAKRKPASGATAWIGPLNAVAAGGLSYVKWSSTPGAGLWIFFAGSAAVYLLDALLRARVRPPSSLDPADVRERALSGYEGAMTLAAALAVPAIFLKLSGMWINAGLLLEAEALFLGGLLLGQSYLRHLGSGVFLVSLAKLVIADLAVAPARRWTPVALLTAVIFYVNRALRRPGLEYSYPAAALLALVIGFEAPVAFTGIAWLGLAIALFEFGFWTRLLEFRLQAYGLAALGWLTLVAVNGTQPEAHPWNTLAAAALVSWAVAAQVLVDRGGRLGETEGPLVRDFSSGAGTLLAGVLIWRVTPRGFLGLAWMALGVWCYEAGRAARQRSFRRQGDAAAALGILTLTGINVFGLGGVPERQILALAGAAMLGYLMAVRVFRWRDAAEGRRLDVLLSSGTCFAAALAWYLLPGPLVAVSWGILALLLVEIGTTLALPIARLNGNVLAICGFGRLFMANFTIGGRTLGISHRVLTVAPYAILCYYLHNLTDKARDRFARFYLYAGAILLVVLMRQELGRTMTVVGWSILGVALVYCGHRLKKPDLLWQSYVLAVLTFVRSWTTNFYIPESLLGMPVRVLTGAIVVAAFYASEFLSPRAEQVLGQVKPRVLFSCLATALLTVMLYYEVSGSLLTVAWGIQGIGLLLAGFPLRERVLRLAGLALFFFCISKLFFYDLRELETGYRILSFFVLGLLLLGASWVYTRFREQLKQLL
jgi:hypothetical protein